MTTLAELQSILLDFPCRGPSGPPTCSCGSDPCIGSAAFGLTQSFTYWSATSYLPDPKDAWNVFFSDGFFNENNKMGNFYARAVRGGL